MQRNILKSYDALLIKSQLDWFVQVKKNPPVMTHTVSCSSILAVICRCIDSFVASN